MDDYGTELAAQDMRQINARFDKGAQRMAAIERDLLRVTAELQSTQRGLEQLCDEIAELVEFFRDMKGAFKVFRWIGKLAAPMTAIIGLGVAVATAWTAARGGRP